MARNKRKKHAPAEEAASVEPHVVQEVQAPPPLDGARIVRELRLDEVQPGMCILFEVTAGEDFEVVVQQLESWADAHPGVEVLVMREGVRFAGVEGT